MIFCSWNIRGLNKPFKQKELKNFLFTNKVVLIGCLETKVKANKAEKVKKKMGNEWEVANDYTQSQNGRIWIWDFNAILSVNDKQNGVPVHPTEIKDFQDCIEDIGFGQLKRTGSLFSWSNKRDAQIRIHSLIDWAFGNAKWFDNYGHLETVYHNPGCSDHTPIIVSTGRIRQSLPRPFRLLNVLLQNQSFKEVTQTVWQYKIPGYAMYGICKKLKLIELNTKHLHKEVSNLQKRVEVIRGRIQDTQQMLNSDLYNSNLIQEERALILELEKWSNIHEEVLRQKSRAIWLAKGYSNTRYFHAQMKTRQARNHISSICNDQGIMLTDPGQIQQEFIKFFQDLLGTKASELPCLNSNIAKDGYCLNREDQQGLIKPVMQEEIVQALKDLPADKAPGGRWIPC
ncbi:PREDICTED: uncharacterized protein LOC109227614 [Nicotiana attenuata]|uniref:uncharacterized protein LOC109227614 n=1 Tax=Nicotiana attenuata TaxID=49451 RepID=UPI000905BC58|nr:PREDICTED: uncharacterized protein LOC109227614 [Nicotiana attenuata]